LRRELAKRRHFDPERFARDAAADAAAFALSGDADAELGRPQLHHQLVDEPVILRAGQSWRASPLSVRASHEKVRFQQQGAMISAPHLVATVENVGPRPIAYFLELSANDRGRCEVRGARMHNALALMPGERAEIVVCGGAGRLRIQRGEALEISELGYFYLSKLPPTAVQLDHVSQGAHSPDRRATPCTEVDPESIAGLQRAGRTRWVDVVDFFSRHNCERFRYFEDYRHAESARALPFVPQEAPADEPFGG